MTIFQGGVVVSVTVEDICEAALPIELLRMEAITHEKTVMVKWQTATETNNEYIAVERSTDGRYFTEIGRRAGAGNSTQVIHYQFEDEHPAAGWNYYRLRQHDYDDTQTYSKVVSAYLAGTSHPTFVCYPTVVQSGAYLTIEALSFDDENDLQVQILDLDGRVLQTHTLASPMHRLQTHHLPKGMYIVSIIKQNAKRSTHRFIVMD